MVCLVDGRSKSALKKYVYGLTRPAAMLGARPGTGFMKKEKKKYCIVECVKCHKKHRHYFEPKTCPFCGSRGAYYKNKYVAIFWGTKNARISKKTN